MRGPFAAQIQRAIRSLLDGSFAFSAGSGGATGSPIVPLFASVTPASNVGTGETDLASFSMPGNTLNADRQMVRVTAWGTLAANANTKTIRLYFGATLVINHGTTQQSAWRAEMIVARSGAAAQRAGGWVAAGNAFGTGQVAAASPAETLSGAVTIRVTGTSGTASDDITLTGILIEWLPAGASS